VRMHEIRSWRILVLENSRGFVTFCGRKVSETFTKFTIDSLAVQRFCE
jgi:hypothetical protein